MKVISTTTTTVETDITIAEALVFLDLHWQRVIELSEVLGGVSDRSEIPLNYTFPDGSRVSIYTDKCVSERL